MWSTEAKEESSRWREAQPITSKKRALRPGWRSRSTKEGTYEVLFRAPRQRNGEQGFVQSTEAKEETTRWREATTKDQEKME
jgi:hypothetical protein